ncbi:MAG: hypothetical protein ACI8TE_001054 [Francisella sp.]|jgi:uncharacterized protein (TIGR00645 family)
MINKILSIIEKFIFGIRWLQAPIYMLLSLVLVGFIYEIYHELFVLFSSLGSFNEEKLIILALTLCDVVLVANLVVIVVISGYENFVSKMNLEKSGGGQPLWIKKLSPNAVKLKIAGSIIGISSISLLKKILRNFSNIRQRFIMGCWYPYNICSISSAYSYNFLCRR